MMSAAAVRIPPARCKEAAGLGCMIGRTKEPFGAFEHLAKTTLRIRWLDSQNVLRGSPPRVVFAKVPRFEGGLRQGSRCRSSANVGSTRRHSCCSGVAAMQGAAATATTTQHRCFGTAAAAHTQRHWRLAWPPAPRRRHLMKGLRVVFNPPPTVTHSNGGDVSSRTGDAAPRLGAAGGAAGAVEQARCAPARRHEASARAPLRSRRCAPAHHAMHSAWPPAQPHSTPWPWPWP